MSGPPAEPGTQALAESLAALAAQLADLRGQVAQVNHRLDRAGLRGDLDLVARFEELARSVADMLDAAAPRGPAVPSWIGLDRETYVAELAKLRHWADTVLRQHGIRLDGNRGRDRDACGSDADQCWDLRRRLRGGRAAR